jgi:hypothetical protein
VQSPNYNLKTVYPEPEDYDTRMRKEHLDSTKTKTAFETAGLTTPTKSANLINIVGGITILLGIFSLLTYSLRHPGINTILDLGSIILGFFIIQRLEIARVILVYVLGAGAVFSFFNLLTFLLTSSETGAHPPLFSMIVGFIFQAAIAIFLLLPSTKAQFS